ncbi:translocation/assembly module TamB domain-containing protein [Sphingomonas sp. GlSt437]
MVGWGVVGLLALIGAGVVAIDSDIGHRFLVDRIAALRPANGLRYSIGRIKGSIFGRATLVDVRISDPKGVVLAAPVAELDWAPWAWLGNRLDIQSLIVPVARLEKLPQLRPTGRTGPILPGFDIHVGLLRVDRLIVAPAITGVARTGMLQGRADVRHGRALVDLAARVEGSDRLRLLLDAEPDRDRLDIDLHAQSAATGVLARMAGLAKPLAIDVDGKGRWQDWRGRALMQVAGATAVDLALANQAGRYSLSGALTPAAVTTSKLARLGSPRVQVNGAATFANRQIDGSLSLRSPALAVEVSGGVDLAQALYRNVRLTARLLDPKALVPDMTGRAIELRLLLDGAFDTALFDYRLAADHVAFGPTGFDQARADGRGHLSRLPVIVPIALQVARVTGVGDVAGGILRNLSVTGAFRADASQIAAKALKFRSDKLNGTVDITLDLKSGQYQVGLTGTLARYLVPGLGIVDVASTLHLEPRPGGVKLVGKGTAQVVRLDNALFRTLAGGLPKLVTGLERDNDGTLHFVNLVLTARDIRLTGNGYRQRDGRFVFAGRGTQARYGPFTLALDGPIERPHLKLSFDHPNEALGLRDVKAELVPTAAGYTLTASGGSLLGAFTGNGQLLLPKGGTGSLIISSLDAGGVHASGTLRLLDNGLDGTVTLVRGGINGTLALSPTGDIQRIEAHLVADRAQFDNGVRLRSGKLDAVALLDPGGASVTGDFRIGGLRRGSLALSRATGSVRLKDGRGQIVAKLSGQRGRAFDINSVIDVAPDRYALVANGTIDQRTIRLPEAAVFTRDGNEWRLTPARILFADGEADISGTFGGNGGSVDAVVTRLPLSLLDIAYPNLGLAGVASGKVSYADRQGAAPVGKVNLTVRGLSRSGLVQVSKPIDVGLAGVLAPDAAVLRAVMASDGKTIGRAQARLAPLGSGDIATRLGHAGLFAQIRYNGPADTLWRLTGLETIDLSGPVAIGADISGSVNDPRIRGALRANGARIESPVTGTVLTNVQAAGAFSGSKLAISSFAADAGKGGRVTGTGTFDFAAVNGFGIDLSLQGANALAINRDDIAATVTGPLTIKSDGSGGTIAGTVTLDKGRYRLGQAAAATAIPRLNIREINLPNDDVDDDVPVKPWRLDIAAHADRGLTVTGLGLSSEWSATLRIQGEPTDPIITGRADLVRGNYEFAGREFALERGAIRFGGEQPVDPTLDIQANGDATNLSASIRVTGQATKPLISFTSVPALPEDELLSRLLFGTSITNLSAPEALQLAAAVSALQNGGNGLNPINAVRRAVGLDRLRILPADPTIKRATAFAAGKYVTRRLYAEIITDGQGYSATQVEFQVTRWLSLLSTVSTLGRTSANVKVSKDY